MSQSKWAAIVYSRTYEVDFRLIVMPTGFNNEDKQWAEKYILGTTRLPEKLREQPRWSLFKNEHYCVIGVTCMLTEIMATSGDENISEMMLDNGNRPVYGFFGYVTELTKDSDVEIPAMNLELFTQLYKYVADKWHVKSFESASKIPDESQYEVDFKATDIAVREVNYFALNHSDKRINLYPNSHAKDLWFEASRCRYPISLCLGIAREKDAIDGTFLNATASDVIEVGTREKQNQPRVSASHLESEKRHYQSEDYRNQSNQDDDWSDYTGTDWGEESETDKPCNRNKIAEFFNNPLDFVAAEIKELGQELTSNSNYLESPLANSSNPEDREYYQDRDEEIKNFNGDINRYPKRSRSSKQPEPLTDTSFGLVEKPDSKDNKTPTDQQSTESSNTDNDWFK
ncbi:hypothetical protein H6G80_34805 [Nostoc sp. FACHB-87]|uniref:hypothetical protein n=1 Tax=Nostocaceae TaxID=1162 RepID=UPI00168283FC|nr:MULTISPECIES: hypothetical protein [Nostocaceae]MBD2459194.1 hypothetical protein [Nostoc sp. FACHB-87]MBD2480204.1 hypothetical protein [Anabaena sp. FACHB-83]